MTCERFLWSLIPPAWLLLEPILSGFTDLPSLHLVSHRDALTNTKLQLAEVQLCVRNRGRDGGCGGCFYISSWAKQTKPLSSCCLQSKGPCLLGWLQVQATKSTRCPRLKCSYMYASIRYEIWHNIIQRENNPSVGSLSGSNKLSKPWCYSPLYSFFLIFLNWSIVDLHVVLVSGIQQSDSVIYIYIHIYTYICVYIYTHTYIYVYIYIYILYQILFPNRLLQNIA